MKLSMIRFTRLKKNNGKMILSLVIAVFFSAVMAVALTSTIRPSFAYSLSAISQNGLQLEISTVSSIIPHGSAFEITITDTNTLHEPNTILARHDVWALVAFTQSPCPPNDSSPLTYAIFPGNYVMNNITKATPLALFPQGESAACPQRDFTYFTLQPSSDIVTAFGGPAPSGVQFKLAIIVTLGSYFNGKQLPGDTNSSSATQYSLIGPGVYTIAGGDEWGNVALLPVQVT